MRNEKPAGTAGEAPFTANPWTTAAQIAIIGLFVLAVTTALYVTRAVAVPLLLALMVGTILAPLVDRLSRHGVPRVVSTIFIVLLLTAPLVIFVVALATPLSAPQDLYATLQSVGASGKQAGQGITVAATPNASIVETLGAVTTLAMYVVGMPNPLLWGVMAGVLNFLPYLGLAIVTIALVVASLVSFPTLAGAAVPPLVYIAVHTIEGEFLTPSVLGYQLSVNLFFLFLSVVFWTWMWGPIGAFLAVPIAMVTAGVLQHSFPTPEPHSLP